MRCGLLSRVEVVCGMTKRGLGSDGTSDGCGLPETAEGMHNCFLVFAFGLREIDSFVVFV